MTKDVKINAGDWNSLSGEEREKITTLLTATGLLKGESSITPDENAESAIKLGATDSSVAVGWPWCTAACDIAQAAAIAACAAFSGPAVGICVAAATAAGNVCRDNC